MLALLAAAIIAVPSSGNPSGNEAKVLARIFIECASTFPPEADVDPELLVALAWKESGFRANAVNAAPGKSRMLGLFQLNEHFLGVRMMLQWQEPRANTQEFCVKLHRVWRHHEKNCDPNDHHVVAHHFSGYRITPKARLAAADTLRRRATIRRMMKHFS